jgi:hypothetical protein
MGIEIAPGKIVKIVIHFIASNNLGSHYIGGIVESFSAEYRCHYCSTKVILAIAVHRCSQLLQMY